MGDSRYGRLFTEADAIEMVRVCLTMQPHGPQDDAARIAENAVREWPGGTFPPDEPLFLLRASDGDQACDAVAQYGRSLSSSTREDVDRMAERARVANAWDAMRTWRPARG